MSNSISLLTQGVAELEKEIQAQLNAVANLGEASKATLELEAKKFQKQAQEKLAALDATIQAKFANFENRVSALESSFNRTLDEFKIKNLSSLEKETHDKIDKVEIKIQGNTSQNKALEARILQLEEKCKSIAQILRNPDHA